MTDRIFVFGSNLAGRHGKGAALFARTHRFARQGVAEGLTGSAYAIPTKDEHIRTLPLDRIKTYVDRFIAFAAANPDKRFQVTPIGTGLAGYSHDQIKPMFAGAPKNCDMPDEWGSAYTPQDRP